MKAERRTHLRVIPAAKTSHLQQAVDGFLLDIQARNLSPRTLGYYVERLGTFSRWLESQEVTDLDAITPNTVRAYLVQLQQRGLKPYTQLAEARAIRAWLNFCVREELLPASPMARVRMPKVPKEILPAFSPDDVKRLLAACRNARETALVLTLLDTGCRAAELCALNVSDVDLKTGAVMVRLGKGGKDRATFLGGKSKKAVWKYLLTRPGAASNEPLFPSCNTGERLTVSGLEQLTRKLGKRAGVANCHPHTFRRSFALWSLRAGMSVYALQALMGHSDLTVLRRYLALVEQDLADAHRQHGAVDSML